jgi:hypothetical protein
VVRGHLPRDRDLGHLERSVAAMIETFASILISSRAHWSATKGSTALGGGSFRMKLPGLQTNACSDRRTELAAKVWHDRLVHLIAASFRLDPPCRTGCRRPLRARQTALDW